MVAYAIENVQYSATVYNGNAFPQISFLTSAGNFYLSQVYAGICTNTAVVIFFSIAYSSQRLKACRQEEAIQAASGTPDEVEFFNAQWSLASVLGAPSQILYKFWIFGPFQFLSFPPFSLLFGILRCIGFIVSERVVNVSVGQTTKLQVPGMNEIWAAVVVFCLRTR